MNLGVTCDYHGRTGNNIFQYVFARLIAERNGLAMSTDWKQQDFIATTPHKPGTTHEAPVVEIKDLYWSQHDVDWMSMNFRNTQVKCSGFFQSPMYYDSNINLVKSFFKLPEMEKRPPGEIVMHVRLDDYADPGLKSVINPNWYGKILYSMQFHNKKNKLYIVTDPKSKNDSYIKSFLSYQPTIISGTAAEDFHFIRQFDTIICSNSSFAWWAAWLSDATKIYTFAKWIREPHGQKIRLPLTLRATPIHGEWLP